MIVRRRDILREPLAAASRETPSAVPISPHERPLARARATNSRTRASPPRMLSTAFASGRIVHRYARRLELLTSFAAGWIFFSVFMIFAPGISGVSIGGAYSVDRSADGLGGGRPRDLSASPVRTGYRRQRLLAAVYRCQSTLTTLR